MKLTVNKLKELGACSPGVEWFSNQSETNPVKLINLSINQKLHQDWANWLVTRLHNRENKIKYAVFAAEDVLHLFEKVYPNDNRPRKVIEAVKNNSVTEGIIDAAADSARAAYYAADDAAYFVARAAYYAARAAYYAARAAYYAADYARAAYYAARAAYYAARAADAATDARAAIATDAADYSKYLKYGLKLLKEQERL